VVEQAGAVLAGGIDSCLQALPVLIGEFVEGRRGSG